MTRTDNKFFTNEPGASLLDRFKQTLKDIQLFDAPVIVALYDYLNSDIGELFVYHRE